MTALDQQAIRRFAAVVKMFVLDQERALTRRELEVLYLRAIEGLRPLEIAERFVVSVKTIEAHRAHVAEKTGMRMHEYDLAFARAYWTQFGREQVEPLLEKFPYMPQVLSALDEAALRMHELLADPELRALTTFDDERGSA